MSLAQIARRLERLEVVHGPPSIVRVWLDAMVAVAEERAQRVEAEFAAKRAAEMSAITTDHAAPNGDTGGAVAGAEAWAPLGQTHSAPRPRRPVPVARAPGDTAPYVMPSETPPEPYRPSPVIRERWPYESWGALRPPGWTEEQNSNSKNDRKEE